MPEPRDPGLTPAPDPTGAPEPEPAPDATPGVGGAAAAADRPRAETAGDAPVDDRTAQTPTGPMPPRTWREIGRDIVRPGRSQLILALILLLCGLAVTMQLTAQRDQRYTNLRQDELVAMLDDVTAETRRLESEVGQLERTRDRLASGADADQVAREEAHERLDALELLAGTVPARGPGVEITIDDRFGKITPEVLLNVIEELRDAGAEVLAVDDVRLVASSAVTVGSGGALQIDGVTLRRPMTILAIGDGPTLAEATRFRGGLVSTIEGDRVKGHVTVKERDVIDITATVTPRPMRYGRPG